jgi:hypothetical protein
MIEQSDESGVVEERWCSLSKIGDARYRRWKWLRIHVMKRLPLLARHWSDNYLPFTMCRSDGSAMRAYRNILFREVARQFGEGGLRSAIDTRMWNRFWCVGFPAAEGIAAEWYHQPTLVMVLVTLAIVMRWNSPPYVPPG